MSPPGTRLRRHTSPATRDGFGGAVTALFLCFSETAPIAHGLRLVFIGSVAAFALLGFMTVCSGRMGNPWLILETWTVSDARLRTTVQSQWDSQFHDLFDYVKQRMGHDSAIGSALIMLCPAVFWIGMVSAAQIVRFFCGGV